jgi:hypothetical protein
MTMHLILAYIDPGAGSLLIQLLIGGLAGLAALVRFRWNRIKAAFTRKPQEESNG